MQRAPRIGERVRYSYLMGAGETWEELRTCTGTVLRIYPSYADEFDEDTGDLIRHGKLEPEREWSAAVKVDAPLPKWWAYGDKDVFAPSVSELDPL